MDITYEKGIGASAPRFLDELKALAPSSALKSANAPSIRRQLSPAGERVKPKQRFIDLQGWRNTASGHLSHRGIAHPGRAFRIE